LQPFHRALSSASSKGRGVAGVLDADFIKPTHDKQDFEKSQLFQRLMNRLRDMTTEYWYVTGSVSIPCVIVVVSFKSSLHQSLLRTNDHHAMFRFLRDIYCHKIGYGKTPRVRAAPIPPPRPPPAMLPMESGTAEPLERTAPAPAVSLPPLRPQGTCVNAVPIAIAPPSFGSAPAGAGTAGVAPRAPTGHSPSDTQIMQANQRTSSSLPPGPDLKRKRSDRDAALTVPLEKRATHDLVGSSSSGDQVSTDNHAARPCHSVSALCLPP